MRTLIILSLVLLSSLPLHAARKTFLFGMALNAESAADTGLRDYVCDSEADLPVSGFTAGSRAFCKAEVSFFRALTDNNWTEIVTGGTAWGDITGTLSAQTDLQAALDAKGTSNFSGAYADLTGKPTLGTAAATDTTAYATAAQGVLAGTALQPAGNGSALTGLTKTQVGLANADNTSDANKPVSTATQTALDAKQATLVSATNIKTINGSTVLGSGNLVVSASAPTGTGFTHITAGAQDAAAKLVDTADINDAQVTLAKMANLAQDQFIVRTTASTGVPETATVTAAARTMLAKVAPWGVYNASVALQSGFATDTYLTGSSCAIPSGSLQAKSMYRCRFQVVKTAAGTAAPIINIRVGTAGTTADTSRGTMTWTAQTAVVDEGVFEIFATFRTVGGGTSAVLQTLANRTHRLSVTGLGGANSVSEPEIATSGGFDSTVSNLIIGLSVNAGASAAWTVNLVQAELINLN